ncbi:MAG: aminoacyl-tRNA hydrolase [Oscillospiraceae bacterium]|nr:aminoacyl-tRNA hydrolase [Oscillospiraceae bacterium]
MFGITACNYLIVGLGNPGREYERSRHNVGFRTVDLLASALGAKINRLKFRALVSPPVSCAGKKVVFMKPQTFMNASGDAVKLAGAFYKLPPDHILVIFDDISLPVGRIRIRQDGSAGGHNGVKSIIAQLGGQAFPRIKIGVGAKPNPDYDLADWVLSGFSAQEEKLLAPALERGADAARDILKNGISHAENLFNGQ